MPLVLINPVIKPSGEPSPPRKAASVSRKFTATSSVPPWRKSAPLGLKGETIQFACGGLLARVIQHEYDHLNGILFIDRMKRETKEELQPQLEELQAATKAALKAKK